MRRLAVMVLALVFTIATQHVAAGAEVRNARGAAAQDSVSAVIRQLLMDSAAFTVPAHRLTHVRQVYEARAYAPIWVDSGSGPARAQVLLDSIATAPLQGLRRSDYALTGLRASLETVRRAPDPLTQAKIDVQLTLALATYAENLLTGQLNPRVVNREWHLASREVTVDSALLSVLAEPDIRVGLASLRPQDPDYALLVQQFARYRAIVDAGGWVRLSGARVLHPRDTLATVLRNELVARLRAEGYEVPSAPPISTTRLVSRTDTVRRGVAAAPRVAQYDTRLAGVVAEYQRRHGLTPDSILGKGTRESLNQPAQFRMQQIAANLERHRWMPPGKPQRYVIVNVPAFSLRAYDAGKEVLAMNVVVGEELDGHSTPVFADTMEYVVFRPYWNVPDGIANKELWPKQRQDPGYFAEHGYEVVGRGRDRYVRQRPGPENSLGDVKFLFPNDFDIYLHDTPAKHLFSEAVRAFSHGCIRVERPDELAAFALEWDMARVITAMKGGKENTRANLPRPLPVYIVYFTTYSLNGVLNFGADIYGRDEPLARALSAEAR